MEKTYYLDTFLNAKMRKLEVLPARDAQLPQETFTFTDKKFKYNFLGATAKNGHVLGFAMAFEPGYITAKTTHYDKNGIAADEEDHKWQLDKSRRPVAYKRSKNGDIVETVDNPADAKSALDGYQLLHKKILREGIATEQLAQFDFNKTEIVQGSKTGLFSEGQSKFIQLMHQDKEASLGELHRTFIDLKVGKLTPLNPKKKLD